MQLSDLVTPCAVVDTVKMTANLAKMKAKIDSLGVAFRPHLKTSKSAHFARLMTQDQFGGVTVSTVTEAAYFFEEGFTDVVYAVGITSCKIPALAAAVACGQGSAKNMATVITDSVPGITAVAAAVQKELDNGVMVRALRVLVEVDVGHHRGGVEPNDDDLIVIAKYIHDHPALEFGGVLTHAGHSYGAKNGPAQLVDFAENERLGVTTAADRLRAAGLPCTIVSAGSTPTSTHSKNAAGLTELRAGVYCFQDLDQAGIGSCAINDIALSVLTTVIGHNKAGNKLIVDAGGLAMSKDLCAGQHAAMKPVGYGWIVGFDDALYVAATSQEHGHVKYRDENRAMDFAQFPVGTQLRVLPNHSCYTAAAYPRYHLFDAATGAVTQTVTRCNGFP
jgi:D-serine deaminase-like pyridoxal phosphate-dependent protein